MHKLMCAYIYTTNIYETSSKHVKDHRYKVAIY